MTLPVILHIDFDSFFASVEEQEIPSLRGKAFGVTAANSRTALIAISKEAKKYGLTGGIGLYEARKHCPTITSTPAHFSRYFEISKNFIRICRLYSPFVEVFSIDELFLDVTQTAPLFGGSLQLIKHLKAQIAREIGEYVTVSIGIAHNKSLAKLASGLDKPNGITTITKDNLESIYSQVSLTEVCGIGSRISKRLMSMGVTTLLQLRTIPFSALKAEFGPHEARFLQDVAWGKDEAAVIGFGNGVTTKSVGRNYNLPRNEYNHRIVLQTVFELFEEVSIKLRKLSKKARAIGIFLSGDSIISGRKTTDFYMQSGKEMFDAAYQEGMLNGLSTTSYIRQVHVWASSLADSWAVPTGLFDIQQKKDQLLETIDRLNARFGNHTIRNGFLLKGPKLSTVPNGFLADRWERTQLASLDR